MIEYRYKEEKEIALRYAKLLGDDAAVEILKQGRLSTTDEVRALARFYWAMVDKAAEEKSSGHEDMEKWLERIYTSFHIYMSNNGYSDVWDEEIP